jgi:hypothetical protein
MPVNVVAGLGGSERSLPDSLYRDPINRPLVNSPGLRSGSAATSPSASHIAITSVPLAELNSNSLVASSSGARRAAPYYNVTSGMSPLASRSSTGCCQDELVNRCTPPKSLPSTEAHTSVKPNASIYYNVVAVGRANGTVKSYGGADAASSHELLSSVVRQRFTDQNKRTLRRNSLTETRGSLGSKVRYKRLTRSCPCLRNSPLKPDESRSTLAEYINMDDALPDKSAKSSRNVHSVKRRSSDMLENSAAQSMSPSRKYHTSSSSSVVQATYGPPLLKTMPKRSLSGTDASHPLPYYDLGPYDGDICDDGYLYFPAEDNITPRTCVSGLGRPDGRERVLPCTGHMRQCNTCENDVTKPATPRRSVVTQNYLLNCVPPAPQPSERSAPSLQLTKINSRPYGGPVNRAEQVSKFDGPVLCAVDFPPTAARGARPGCRVMSATTGDRRQVVRQKLAIDEPDYLDMSRDRLLDLQRQESASQNSTVDYLPMDNLSRPVDAAKYSSGSHKKTCRLVKSQSADGLIDQMDSESGSDTVQNNGKAPDLIARILGSRNRSSGGLRTDLVDDEALSQSLLCSSTASVATDATPESLRASRGFIECPFVENTDSKTTAFSDCQREQGVVESSEEPPPLPEKQRTGNGLNSALSLVPPVPPRVGVDVVRPASAASARPRLSRKPDLTVDIPKTTSDNG